MSAWQIAASDGNHCAAALLSLFEFWLQADSEQFHTARQIETGLLGLFAEDKIREAVRLLVAKDFVRAHKNTDAHLDRTIYYYFVPAAVNEWLETYTAK